MHITNQTQCLESWQESVNHAQTDPSIPEMDRQRMLYELEALYSEMLDYFALQPILR